MAPLLLRRAPERRPHDDRELPLGPEWIALSALYIVIASEMLMTERPLGSPGRTTDCGSGCEVPGFRNVAVKAGIHDPHERIVVYGEIGTAASGKRWRRILLR